MFAEIILLVLILMTVLLILLFDIISPTTSTDSASQSLDELVETSGWSATDKSDGTIVVNGETYTGLDVCRIYSTLNEDVINVVKTPSDALTDLPESRQCLTDYSKALVLSQRVCFADQCIGNNGDVYKNGQIEKYFTACGNLKRCTNTDRRTLTFNFVVNPSNPPVIETNPSPVCLNQSGSFLDSDECTSKIVPSSELFYLDKQELEGEAFQTTVRSPQNNTCLADNLEFVLCSSLTGGGQIWLYTPVLDFSSIGAGSIPSSLSYSPSIPSNITFTPQTTSQYSALRNYLLSLKKISSNAKLVNQTTNDPNGNIYVLTPHVWSIVGT